MRLRRSIDSSEAAEASLLFRLCSAANNSHSEGGEEEGEGEASATAVSSDPLSSISVEPLREERGEDSSTASKYSD